MPNHVKTPERPFQFRKPLNICVTVANQFTVKLQRAPKASRKNTCISFIYHSYRAIPIFFASRFSTCTPTSSRG